MRLVPALAARRLLGAMLALPLLLLPVGVHGQQQQPVGVTRPAVPEGVPIAPGDEPRSCRQALVRSVAIGAAVVSATYALLAVSLFHADAGDVLHAASLGVVAGAIVGPLAQVGSPPCLDLSGGPPRR